MRKHDLHKICFWEKFADNLQYIDGNKYEKITVTYECARYRAAEQKHCCVITDHSSLFQLLHYSLVFSILSESKSDSVKMWLLKLKNSLNK